MRLLAVLLSLFVCALPGCGSPGGQSKQSLQSISLFAAASTKEAAERITKDFEGALGIHVEVTLGPSSGLAKQIEQGASADLFLSADQASADYLSKKDLVRERCNLLINRLVVVVPTDSKIEVTELRDLADPGIRRLALAEPKVPAGEYARQALRKAGVWERVESSRSRRHRCARDPSIRGPRRSRGRISLSHGCAGSAYCASRRQRSLSECMIPSIIRSFFFGTRRQPTRVGSSTTIWHPKKQRKSFGTPASVSPGESACPKLSSD